MGGIKEGITQRHIGSGQTERKILLRTHPWSGGRAHSPYISSLFMDSFQLLSDNPTLFAEKLASSTRYCPARMIRVARLTNTNPKELVSVRTGLINTRKKSTKKSPIMSKIMFHLANLAPADE